jgi:hypothetical protein
LPLAVSRRDEERETASGALSFLLFRAIFMVHPYGMGIMILTIHDYDDAENAELFQAVYVKDVDRSLFAEEQFCAGSIFFSDALSGSDRQTYFSPIFPKANPQGSGKI